MKRYGNLFQEIVSLENLRLADQKARKGKRKQKGVQLHDRNAESNLFNLHTELINGSFATSKYSTFTVHEPKERLVLCPKKASEWAKQHSLEFYHNEMNRMFCFKDIERKVSLMRIEGRKPNIPEGLHGFFEAMKAGKTFSVWCESKPNDPSKVRIIHDCVAKKYHAGVGYSDGNQEDYVITDKGTFYMSWVKRYRIEDNGMKANYVIQDEI